MDAGSRDGTAAAVEQFPGVVPRYLLTTLSFAPGKYWWADHTDYEFDNHTR